MTYAVIAIGLIFVVEGLIWALAPSFMVETLAAARHASLRIYGWIVAAAGVAIIGFLRCPGAQ